MFAIVQCGGKQYRVAPDDVISVEKLNNAVGDKVTLNVMLIGDNGSVVAGNPFVSVLYVKPKLLLTEKVTKSLFSNISQRRMRERNKVTDNHSLN